MLIIEKKGFPRSWWKVSWWTVWYYTNGGCWITVIALPLYLTIGDTNGYNEEINGNKYFTLVLTDEGKDKPKKYGRIWSKN